MGQPEHQKGQSLLRTNKQKNPVLSSRFHDYTKNKANNNKSDSFWSVPCNQNTILKTGKIKNPVFILTCRYIRELRVYEEKSFFSKTPA